jgi:hypothetical protein
VLHLESYPHHRGPLDVVGLGEGRPPAVGTDVPDNGLDPMVTMVPVWGGRVAPPVKAVISVNPATGASTPVWAVAAVGGTAVVRAPARRAVWAAATTPLGCTAAHCTVCSRATSLASLSSLSLSSSVETELPMLLAHRASSLLLLLLSLLLPVPPSPALPSLPPSLQSLSSLSHVPLPWQPRPPTGAARSRRPRAETVFRAWCASAGLLRGEEAASDKLLLVCAGEEG